jgi:hypothetical protein
MAEGIKFGGVVLIGEMREPFWCNDMLMEHRKEIFCEVLEAGCRVE